MCAPSAFSTIPRHMRLLSCLTRPLAALRDTLAEYRVNIRALLYGCGLILIVIGVWEMHPAAGKIVLGLLLIADVLIFGRLRAKK